MGRYLFWMRMDMDYFELIEGELLSVAAIYGVTPEHLRLSYHKNESKSCTLYSTELRDHYLHHYTSEAPPSFDKLDTTQQNIFLYGTVPSETTAGLIFNRCTLLRTLVNVWAEALSYDELLHRLLSNQKALIQSHLLSKKWAVKYHRYNNKASADDLTRILEKLAPVFHTAGEVDLTNPDTRIAIIEVGGLHPQKYSLDKKTREKSLERIYFGNILFDRVDAPWWHAYSLSTRPILAPTSLENSLSFIMSNLARVTRGSVVYDPFVGSGGALIPATIFGGYCFGSDIDIRTLRGWGISYKNLNAPSDYDSTSIFTNFDHYKLLAPDVVRFDIRYVPFKGTCGSPPGWVDAIITDPPYGIRASYNHSKLMKNINSSAKHSDCFELIDVLFRVSERLLVPGGRLVFLLPGNTARLGDSLGLINRSGFALIHIGQQVLSGGATRFVVALERGSG